MSRGRLVPPNLDDRTWQDIVNQARALIPKYAPEWTDHNPSDPGIALIELFAWIVESMIYRLNRVPEKNLIAFLNLLDITRDPATPATAQIRFQIPPTSAPFTIPQGTQVGSLQTDTEPAIIFETDKPLEVLPTSLKQAVLVEGNIYRRVSTALVDSPLGGLRLRLEGNQQGNQSRQLLLGFDAAVTVALPLMFQFSKPAPPEGLEVRWRYSTLAAPPSEWATLATERLDDQTEGLQGNGQVAVTVPSSWTAQNSEVWAELQPQTPEDLVDTPLFWVGLELENVGIEPPSAPPGSPRIFPDIELGLDYILANAVAATHALSIRQSERLGTGSGEPFQRFELAHTPLYKQPGAENPYDHLVVEVRSQQLDGGFGPWQPWSAVEDLPKGVAAAYRLNPVTGTLYLGNDHPTLSPDGHGTIPPSGSELQAVSYRYVTGGVAGNVPPGSLTIIRTPIPGAAVATNVGPATGGSDEESIEDTQRRAPELLRNRYRAVTVEDYEYLAQEASTDIQKVRALGPRLVNQDEASALGVPEETPWNYGGISRSPGGVTVIVIPAAPLGVPRPTPSDELIQEVRAYLGRRRSVATRLQVVGPRYLPIRVSASIQVWRSAVRDGLTTTPDLESQVIETIHRFLHPLWGGPQGSGWDIGQEIAIADLFDVIQPPRDIGFISNLAITAMDPAYSRPHSINVPGVWLPVADYEIVCSHTDHAIQAQQV